MNGKSQKENEQKIQPTKEEYGSECESERVKCHCNRGAHVYGTDEAVCLLTIIETVAIYYSQYGQCVNNSLSDNRNKTVTKLDTIFIPSKGGRRE